MLPFKKNLHIAKRQRLEKVFLEIIDYPPEYPTPKYLLFIKRFLEEGWEVKVYVAKVSKYVFVIREGEIYKIRFSNHKPLYHKQMENDCDFYVGVSHKQCHTIDEIIKKILD